MNESHIADWLKPHSRILKEYRGATDSSEYEDSGKVAVRSAATGSGNRATDGGRNLRRLSTASRQRHFQTRWQSRHGSHLLLRRICGVGCGVAEILRRGMRQGAAAGWRGRGGSGAARRGWHWMAGAAAGFWPVPARDGVGCGGCGVGCRGDAKLHCIAAFGMFRPQH